MSTAATGLLLNFLLGAVRIGECPSQLLGCMAYVWTPLGISNRIFSLSVSMSVAIVVMLATLLVLSLMASERRRQTFSFVLLAFAPVALQLVSGNFNVKGELDLSWLAFALSLSAAVIALQFRKNRKATAGEFCLLFESFFVPYGFYLAIRALVFGIGPASYSVLVSWVAHNLAWIPYLGLLTFLLVLMCPRREPALSGSARLMWLQLLALPLFCALLPEVFSRNGELVTLHARCQVFCWVVVPVALIAAADIALRYFKPSLLDHPFSPFPLIAILTLHHFRQFTAMGFTNFYEYGDRISAYVAIRSGAMTCFKDVTPCYGLWDWLQLRLTEFFSDSLTMADAFGESLMIFLVLAFSFCVFFHMLPVGIAFLLSYFWGGWVAALVAAWMMLWLNPAWMKRRAVWCAGWAASACFVFFFRVPQGAVLVAAFLPLFLFQFVQSFLLERKAFQKLLAFLLSLAVMMLVWPFASYFYGMVRIVMETGSINSAWAASAWETGTGNLLPLLSANAIVLLPMIVVFVALALMRWAAGAMREVRGAVAFGLITVAFLGVLGSMSYCFSRIDDLYSRQYQMWSCLLPLIISPAVWMLNWNRTVARVLIALAFIPLVSLGVVRQLHVMESPCRLMATTVPMIDTSAMFEGADYGLAKLGCGYAPASAVDELKAEGELVRVLDKVLDPDETFLNLSLYGGLYFASGRTLPWRHTNYYTVTGDKTQRFMLKQLEGKKIGASVFGRDNYDFSYPMLRTRLLFHHAITNALPYKVNDRYFVMLPADRFARIGEPAPSVEESLQIWDDFYNDPDNLYRFDNLIYLPSAWGVNAEKLIGADTERQELSVVREDSKTENVSIATPVSGDKWGLMVVDSASECWAGCRWTNEFGASHDICFKLMPGPNIVPLDAYPRWYLAKRNVRLQFFAQDRDLDLHRVMLIGSKE